MNDDRDPLVVKALQDLPVPNHGPDFWRKLEERLSVVEAPSAPVAPGTPVVPTPDEQRVGDLPVVAHLADHRRWRAPAWIATAAAVIALVMAAATTLTSDEPPSEQVRITGPASDGQEAPAPTNPPATTTTAPTTPRAPDPSATPDAALLEWLAAVGTGDTDTAAALTGPRSKAYVDALTGGAGIEGFLLEAGEGYGAWADSPDRSTTEVDLDVEGEDITIVVVSGTWTGEGGTGFRVDAVPVVRSDDGTWLVEPWATDPDTGGRLAVLSPAAAEEGRFNGLDPDATLSASAPGFGTFHFSLDDQPPTRITGQTAGGGVRATFDPPGSMSTQTHLFVIAYTDGQTISAVAGTFTVEG
jgi:hypothetical protein